MGGRGRGLPGSVEPDQEEFEMCRELVPASHPFYSTESNDHDQPLVVIAYTLPVSTSPVASPPSQPRCMHTAGRRARGNTLGGPRTPPRNLLVPLVPARPSAAG